ncbi:MAG TPA: hypothetical protein PLH97_09425 [Verrucomicrobiota bacterium]|nr:hypothetical protein [Verrucomicrobiota bacterium]
MNILTKLLGAFAAVLFIGFLVFTFLGLDSVERPATMPLMTAGEVCLATSAILFLIRFICLRTFQRRTDESVDESA